MGYSKLMCRQVTLALVAIVLAGGCKKAREWAEKHNAERKAERERVELVHAAEPAPIRARPNGPGLRPGKYRMIELHVEALPTNERGKPWDPPSEPDPDPDLEITIAVGEKRHSCRLPENRIEGRCKLAFEIAIDDATRIDVNVVDRDALVDDPIGTATLEDPSRWGTKMELPLIPNGRVRAATIVLVRGPTWWDLYGARMIGLCAGGVLALLTIGSFRRTFLPPPPPPPRVPACTHCGAILGASVTKCTNCGAVQPGSPS